MLKDKLLNLTTVKHCAVGNIMEKMDKETKAAFVEVMCSSVGHKTISDALSLEGLKISRDAVRMRRACFAEATKSQCECRMAEMSKKK